MQTIGIIDIVWGGRRLAVEKGAKILLGGLKNNSVMFGRGVARSQEFVASRVTATIVMPKGLRYDDVVGGDERELQALCDTGSTFVFPAAFITDRPEFGDDGKMAITWEAGEYEEILQ